LFRDTPIIILTSQNGLMDRTKAKLNGASDFLSKPPDLHQVLEIVKKYLQQSSTENLPVGSPAIASSPDAGSIIESLPGAPIH